MKNQDYEGRELWSFREEPKIKGKLDTNLLKELGWKRRYEGRVSLWPFRGQLRGYAGERVAIPGFDDIQLAGIGIKRGNLGAGRARTEDRYHQSLIVWLYDAKEGSDRFSPYEWGLAHPAFQFASPRETSVSEEEKMIVTIQDKVDLDNLILRTEYFERWYPDAHPLHNSSHYHHYKHPSDERCERFLSSLKKLVHE